MTRRRLEILGMTEEDASVYAAFLLGAGILVVVTIICFVKRNGRNKKKQLPLDQEHAPVHEAPGQMMCDPYAGLEVVDYDYPHDPYQQPYEMMPKPRRHRPSPASRPTRRRRMKPQAEESPPDAPPDDESPTNNEESPRQHDESTTDATSGWVSDVAPAKSHRGPVKASTRTTAPDPVASARTVVRSPDDDKPTDTSSTPTDTSSTSPDTSSTPPDTSSTPKTHDGKARRRRPRPNPRKPAPNHKVVVNIQGQKSRPPAAVQPIIYVIQAPAGQPNVVQQLPVDAVTPLQPRANPEVKPSNSHPHAGKRRNLASGAKPRQQPHPDKIPPPNYPAYNKPMSEIKNTANHKIAPKQRKQKGGARMGTEDHKEYRQNRK